MATRPLDKPLLGLTILLMGYGVATLYSAGQTDVLTAVQHLWVRQLIWLGIGAVAGFLVYRVSPTILEWSTPYVYGLAVILLLVTLAIGSGAGTAASSKSWITIGGVRLGQPAELAKIATILMLARHLALRRDAPTTLWELAPAGGIVALPVLLVAAQPDLGSAIVFIGILFAMLFWSGVRPVLLLLLGSPLVGLLLGFNQWVYGAWWALCVVLALKSLFRLEAVAVILINSAFGLIALPLWKRLATYQQNRLLSFLNPDVDPRATGWHIIQSKVAIGSGGLFGKGFTLGTQKRLAFLPAQHTDFIFSVVGEELGFVGVLVALILFVALVMTLVRVSRRATDSFSSLVAFGIASMMFIHVLENIGMTAGLMPITGIPLPFFSYGGSFLLTCCMGVGLALRVARDSRLTSYGESSGPHAIQGWRR
ncbi:MAG TPA: rod shape-determining protein RodA [Gemmatimonadales bacterium]|jgi:rod shape determining protein RodA